MAPTGQPRLGDPRPHRDGMWVAQESQGPVALLQEAWVGGHLFLHLLPLSFALKLLALQDLSVTFC